MALASSTVVLVPPPTIVFAVSRAAWTTSRTVCLCMEPLSAAFSISSTLPAIVCERTVRSFEQFLRRNDKAIGQAALEFAPFACAFVSTCADGHVLSALAMRSLQRSTAARTSANANDRVREGFLLATNNRGNQSWRWTMPCRSVRGSMLCRH